MSRFTHNFDRPIEHFPDQMTKIIAVLRHAQSAGKQGGQRDFDRMLTPHGEGDATTLGKKLSEHTDNVELILSSSSVRTRQTVHLANESLHLSHDKIWFKGELYEALIFNWLDYVHNLPMDINQVMLVGHNPCLSQLACSFAGAFIDLSPCELVAFEFNTESCLEIGNRGKEILHIKPSMNDH